MEQTMSNSLTRYHNLEIIVLIGLWCFLSIADGDYPSFQAFSTLTNVSLDGVYVPIDKDGYIDDTYYVTSALGRHAGYVGQRVCSLPSSLLCQEQEDDDDDEVCNPPSNFIVEWIHFTNHRPYFRRKIGGRTTTTGGVNRLPNVPSDACGWYKLKFIRTEYGRLPRGTIQGIISQGVSGVSFGRAPSIRLYDKNQVEAANHRLVIESSNGNSRTYYSLHLVNNNGEII